MFTHTRPPQSPKLKSQINILVWVSGFIKNVRSVQTILFDKITIDFCRARKRLQDSDLPKVNKPEMGPNIRQKFKIIFCVVFGCVVVTQTLQVMVVVAVVVAEWVGLCAVVVDEVKQSTSRIVSWC